MNLSELSIIIILYNPDYSNLNKTINFILSHNINIILIDNSDETTLYNDNFSNENLSYISLNKNMGIAYALNLGIKNSILNLKPILAK